MSQQINLFNPVFRQQKKYFSSVAMAQALGLLCLGCAVLIGDAAIRLRQLQAQVNAANATLTVKQEKLAQFKVQYPPRVKSAALSAELRDAQTELATLQLASTTLARGAYGDSRGFSRFYQALARQRLDGLWLTEVTVEDSGARIGVQGNVLQAAMVPEYMNRLAREPVMQGKSFSTLQIGQPTAAVPAGTPLPTMPFLHFSLQSNDGAAAPGKAP